MHFSSKISFFGARLMSRLCYCTQNVSCMQFQIAQLISFWTTVPFAIKCWRCRLRKKAGVFLRQNGETTTSKGELLLAEGLRLVGHWFSEESSVLWCSKKARKRALQLESSSTELCCILSFYYYWLRSFVKITLFKAMFVTFGIRWDCFLKKQECKASSSVSDTITTHISTEHQMCLCTA